MSGFNKTVGRGIRVPHGTPPPTAPPGFEMRLNETPFRCGNPQCEGPLAHVLIPIFDLLPRGWWSKIDPRHEVRTINTTRRYERRLDRLPSHQSAIEGGGAVRISSSYCCQCGAVGACFTTAGDCRQLPVLQKSAGQC